MIRQANPLLLSIKKPHLHIHTEKNARPAKNIKICHTVYDVGQRDMYYPVVSVSYQDISYQSHHSDFIETWKDFWSQH